MRQKGFTLIEVALAVAVGLVVIAGAVYGYNATQASAKTTKARSIVGTVQTNIGMEKFRQGVPPSPEALFANRDSANNPFYPGVDGGTLPAEPLTGVNGMLRYNSNASPVPIAPGDPTPMWDNPVFAGSPPPTPGFVAPAGYTQPAAYGKGGWLYDPTTGNFRANLSNKDYPAERPGGW